MTKEELKKLTDGGAIIKFIKKDGTERVMKCTTDWKKVTLLDPNFKPPKEKELETENKEENKKPEDPNSLMVWDVEKHEYRRVLVNSIIEAIAI